MTKNKKCQIPSSQTTMERNISKNFLIVGLYNNT